MKLIAALLVACATVFTGRADVITDASLMIMKYEGFRSKTYTCPAGKRTIGYGFTAKKYVDRGTMTRAEATAVLVDLVTADLKWLESVCPNLTEGQKVACLDFVYNLGRANFLSSTFKKKLDSGDMAGARTEIMKWVHCKGKVLNGLVLRRRAECDLL